MRYTKKKIFKKIHLTCKDKLEVHYSRYSLVILGKVRLGQVKLGE
jgi:hypothetical protein